MPSDTDPMLSHLPAQTTRPSQVNEAVSDYRNTPDTIDTDTRLSSADDTETMWVRRPARSPMARKNSVPLAPLNSKADGSPWRGDLATSHTRRDALSGDWTIFAPKRDERPNEFADPEAKAQWSREHEAREHALPLTDPDCPFCGGAEGQTPEAVWSARLGELANAPADDATTRFARPQVHVHQGEQDQWDIRVVPNKFPAVTSVPGSEPDCRSGQNALFPIAPVVGGHDVIVESPMHTESPMQSDSASMYLTLLAYRNRIEHWKHVPGINYISIFKNCGAEAGASLRHNHSQLIATSLMPHRVQNMLWRCEMHTAKTRSALGFDLMRAELQEKKRVIDKTDTLVAYSPFASRFPGMIRVTSLHHQPAFEALPEATLDQLGSFLWRVLSWIEAAHPGKAYNYLLHTFPPGGARPESFQWSLDVFPRLSKTAGFEWSSDCMINSLLPEIAAQQYREIARCDDPRCVLARH